MKLGARSAGATNRWQHRAARERETRRQLKNGGLREGGGTQSSNGVRVGAPRRSALLIVTAPEYSDGMCSTLSIGSLW